MMDQVPITLLVDLDGDQDIAVLSGHGDFISLFLNNNDGTFAPPQVIAERCDRLFNVKFADLNNDGRPDIITNVSAKAILWNYSSGWTSATLPGQKIPRQAIDADGDNDFDLISDSAWFRNDGNGNFTLIMDPDIPSFNAGEVADTADMNNDGFTDCVTSDFILFCNGAGDFTMMPLPSAIYPPFDLGDMNGDGFTDIVARSVFLNDGTGNIFSTINYAQGTGNARDILLHDVDGDSIPDIINSRSGTYDHYIYVNRGAGGGQIGAAELSVLNSGLTSKMFLTDINNDAVIDLVGINYHDIRWYENVYTNAYRLRGTIYQDLNLNAIHDSEPVVPYQLVKSNANNILVWSSSNGTYDLPADTGTFKVWVTPPSVFMITNNPDTLNATLTDLNPIQSGLDFGLAPSGVDSSAVITLETNSFLRCHSEIGVWVTIKNTGIYIPNQSLVKLELNPDLTVNTFYDAPDSISGNQYFWKIDSLGWFQIWTAYLTVNTGQAGSSALMNAGLQWNGNTTFSTSLGGVVICAFDPNDKLVTPQGYGIYGAVPHTTPSLTYTVRFQNTGNDTAFTVVISDALDADLNWSTLEIMAVSHPLTGIQVDNGGIATFRFDQIYLPDSNINEPQSHGFIKYRIQPKNVAEITNTAAIYFDQNDPVITNTVVNTFVNCNNYSNNISVRADTLKVNNTNIPIETYQWLLNNVPVPGATGPWIIPAVSGSYQLITGTVYGCIDTTAAYNVICPFYATVNATSTVLCPNSNITLSTQNYNSYQWYRNNVLIPGATAPTYIVDSVNGSYEYYSVLASLNGCSESSAVLYVYRSNYQAIHINCNGNYYPSGNDFALCDSNGTDSVVFSIPVNYLSNSDITWYKDGVVIPGANTTSLTVYNTGNYTCSVTDLVTCPGLTRSAVETYHVIISSNAQTPVISWNGSQLAATASTLNNWQWYLNDIAIQGANSATHTPVASGNYTVSVSDVYCNFFSDYFPFTVSGLTETSGQPFLLYPNPATDRMYFLSEKIISQIEIFDLSGRIVLSSKINSTQSEINISGLEDGIYNVLVTGNDWQNASRLVIQ